MLGNSRILFLLIPGAVKDAVMRHPEPEKIMGEKYPQFTYYHTDERRPMIVTMRNAASREMLYCASSSGAHYDQREKELKGYRKRDSQPHLVRPVLK